MSDREQKHPGLEVVVALQRRALALQRTGMQLSVELVLDDGAKLESLLSAGSHARCYCRLENWLPHGPLDYVA